MNQIAATMQRAVAAIQGGDYTNACKLAEQALRLHPQNPQIMQVLGIAQSQGGDPAAGLKTMERALSLSPNDASLRFNVAKAAFQTGDYSKVERVGSSLGNQPEAIHLRALAFKESGELEKAIPLFETAMSQSANDPQLLNNYGNALILAGKPREAKTILETAHHHDPRSPQILLNLGRALTAMREFGVSLEKFRQAAALNPQNADVLFELGRSLVLLGGHRDALPLLSEAARKGIRDPEVIVLIGSCYAEMELHEEAEKAYNMALHINPQNLRVHLNLGILLEQNNRIDDLRSLVDSALTKGLRGGDIDYLRATLLQRDGELEEALSVAEAARPEFLDSIILQEFIGKLADRMGRNTLAFDSFLKMNEAMANLPDALKFDGTEHSALIQQRIDAITPEWYHGWTDTPPADDRHIPVMLGGFLRSGTTLLDTILMGHDGVHVREEEAMISRLEEGVGDIRNLAKLDATQIGALRDVYYAELSRGGDVPRGKVLVDKYPLMTVRAAYIHRAFPDAKYLFALRHPCDVVLSCYMQNFKITRAMSAFLRLETAAHFYDTVMRHWERAREVLPLNVHTVRYEDMVVDLEGELRPLIDFIGVDWSDSLLDYQKTAKDRGYIRTPSYAQVTEKVYTRASGRWENYRDQLEPILPILAPWIERFGYEPV